MTARTWLAAVAVGAAVAFVLTLAGCEPRGCDDVDGDPGRFHADVCDDVPTTGVEP